ncbi:HTH_Tnp_Tc3_2 domain-containing protein [Trichonephila clavipes]|nr:HTH_Tnp_Tc3_2 domain-containing protein [Trichonephila clavipes]
MDGLSDAFKQIRCAGDISSSNDNCAARSSTVATGVSYIQMILCVAELLERSKKGDKITDVAREFDIAHSVVSRLWKSFKTTGMGIRRHGGGRVRSTTPAEDRYIVLSAKRNRRTTAQQVANQFLAASGKQIFRKTVARRLRGGGLYARRPVVCVPLTRQNRTARLQWCREHHNWTEQDWACVLFSDESRFSLSSDCRRQLIWRESGTAYRPENIQEKDRYPTCSIMVWPTS